MRIIATAVAVSLLAAPAYAGDKYVIQPVQVGAETVRFIRGEATVSLNKEHGSIQVQPLAFDHGGMSFGIAVYNDGQAPSNFDISSVRVTTQGQTATILSRQDLEKKAKNRAMWTQIGLAALGGLAAASAASQRDTYTATTYTRHGTYRSVFTAPSSAGQVEAAAITAGTAVGVAKIQQQLDRTLSDLSVDIVQLTTVDPGDSYGGRIVVSKVKFAKALPARVDMVVSWNGEDYPLAFQVARPGTPAPAFIERQSASLPPPQPQGQAHPEPQPQPVPAAAPITS